MGRKPLNDAGMVGVSARFPQEMADLLELVAVTKGTSVSTVVREVVIDWLSHQDLEEVIARRQAVIDQENARLRELAMAGRTFLKQGSSPDAQGRSTSKR